MCDSMICIIVQGAFVVRQQYQGYEFVLPARYDGDIGSKIAARSVPSSSEMLNGRGSGMSPASNACICSVIILTTLLLGGQYDTFQRLILGKRIRLYTATMAGL